MPKIAIMNSNESSGFAEYILELRGMKAKIITVDVMIMNGATSKMNLSAFAGTIHSFVMNFIPSATF